jgi:hypothetical protein
MEGSKGEAGPLPQVTASHETETNKILPTGPAVIAEGFTPAVIAPRAPPVAHPATPLLSGYNIQSNNPQVISAVQNTTDSVTVGPGTVNNSIPQADPSQTPVIQDQTGPILSFTSPYGNQIITENAIQIGGGFNQSGHVKNITIGGQKCTIYTASSTFTGPTLISPGEARRKKVEGDSPDYIIMKVDPVTRSGKNILTAQITDDAGHVTEEKVTFYYYQLFVKSTSEWDNPGAGWVSCGFDLPSNLEQRWNADLFKDPPFSGWENMEANYRIGPLNSGDPAWRAYYFYGANYLPYLIFQSYEYDNSLGPEGKVVRTRYDSTLKTDLTFHTMPQTDPDKKTPMVLIFKNCMMLENNSDMPGHPLPVIGAGYKIESADLNWLATRTTYNYFGDSDHDFQDYYIILQDYIPDTDKVLKVETSFNEKGFPDPHYAAFDQKSFYFDSMETLTGDILVDSNNDGFLGDDDNAVKQVAPGCVFWVNDNDDYNESPIHPDDTDPSLASGETDCYDNIINGIRDLEDFMPINLTIPSIKEWTTNQNVKFYLKAEGAGRIKIFERVVNLDEYEAITYLKDLNSSIAQYKKPLLLDIAAGEKKELDPKYFDDNGNFQGIFEGVEKGALKLSLIVELGADSNNKDTVILDEALITLKGIREMYKAVNIRQGPENGTDGLLRYRNKTESGEIFAPDPKRVFIWTHGYNNSFVDSLGYADIVYKRFYRTGFRGSFIFISWDTADWIQPFSAFNFNGDWVNSFRSARITADIIKDTRVAYPDARIDVGAHSLGNSLILYALRLLSAEGQAPVDNVFLAEAAVPGEVFIGANGTPTYDMWGIRHNFFDNMYANSLNAVRGKVYNIYYTNDGALKDAFRGNNLIPKLPTPLDDRYNLMNDTTSTIANEFVKPLGLASACSLYDKLKNVSLFINADNHPYGIRNHCSMTNEYYFDVQTFYDYVLYPDNQHQGR